MASTTNRGQEGLKFLKNVPVVVEYEKKNNTLGAIATDSLLLIKP